MVKKTKNRQFWRSKQVMLWGGIFMLALVLTGSLVLRTKYQNSTNSYKIETPDQSIEESIANGVYTNHTYGFKFEYSERIFLNASGNKKGSFGGNNSIEALSPLDLDENGVWFSTLVRQVSDSSYTFTEELFEQLYEDGDQTISGKALAENVDAISFGDYRRVIYDFRNVTDYEGEHSFAYTAMWKKEGIPVITLELAATSKAVLMNYQDEFKNTVDSFEFIRSY